VCTVPHSPHADGGTARDHHENLGQSLKSLLRRPTDRAAARRRCGTCGHGVPVGRSPVLAALPGPRPAAAAGRYRRASRAGSAPCWFAAGCPGVHGAAGHFGGHVQPAQRGGELAGAGWWPGPAGRPRRAGRGAVNSAPAAVCGTAGPVTGLRPMPPNVSTSGSGPSGLGSGRQREQDPTPGSPSSRPSKNWAIRCGLRRW